MYKPKHEPALVVAHLSFSYPDKHGVLEDVHFTVRVGERVGLIGPNGSGKTTLFLLICGMLKRMQGNIKLFDRAVSYGTFHPDVGMVFQHADDQLFCTCVRDDVAFGPTNMGLSQDIVESRVIAALTTTGVMHLVDRVPHHLSSGEKRMVAIAGVLAMHPRLIIYDEPDANLDSRSRRRLIRFLQTSEETLLLASHDLALILDVCSRVLVLDEGHIVADGNPRDIIGNEALMEAHGLEKPRWLR